MDVDEYVELRKKELDEFAEYWKTMRKKKPKEYPATLPNDGEWFEQELAYGSTSGRETS